MDNEIINTENRDIYLKLDNETKYLNISIKYDMGGYNSFSNQENKRGIYVFFITLEKIENTERQKLFNDDNFKMNLEVLKKRSQKKEKKYFNMIYDYRHKLKELYLNKEIDTLFSLIKMLYLV